MQIFSHLTASDLDTNSNSVEVNYRSNEAQEALTHGELMNKKS